MALMAYSPEGSRIEEADAEGEIGFRAPLLFIADGKLRVLYARSLTEPSRLDGPDIVDAEIDDPGGTLNGSRSIRANETFISPVTKIVYTGLTAVK